MDPIGEWRKDFHMAYLVSIITNIVRVLYAKKGTEPVMSAPGDFMPQWGVDEEEQEEVPDDVIRSWTDSGWVVRGKQTVDQMKRILLGIANTAESKEKRKRK